MLPYLQLGPLHIWTYGLMLACGLWAGFLLLNGEVNRRRLPLDAGALMLAIAAAGIVGAKLYHILTILWTHAGNWSWQELWNPAGLAWNGGLLAGFAVLVGWARAKKVSVWTMLDAASPAAAIGYAFGRMGCFLAGDGDYGIPTNLPWGMSFPHGLVPTTQRVHPTPLYEIADSVLLFFILRAIARRQVSPGTVFAAYLIGSGMFRFAVEFIRLNPPVFMGLTEAQLVSLVSVVGGTVLLSWNRRRALVVAAH